MSESQTQDISASNVMIMTKGEREDLQRLVRQREKVLKSAAKQRSTELLAEFENQLAAEYSFDQDAVWKEATRLAKAEVRKANERIAAQCAKLGIPKDFAPGLHLSWHDRGGNSTKQRRDELRKVAVSRIAAIEQAAVVKIELASVETQTKIAAHGLTSETARSFLEQLPSIEVLMGPLDFREIAGDADPPIVEQLVSPTALRQRRYRERHRNAAVTSQHNAKDEASADPEPPDPADAADLPAEAGTAAP